MNFLFVSGRVAILNNVYGGAGVRSSAMIEALSKIGHVDVISFMKEQINSDIPNCDIIFSKEIGSDIQPFWNRVWFNMRLFVQPWNPYAYFYKNKEREAIVAHFFYQKRYDFVVCHYIDDTVSCGLMNFAEKLIIDVDDNLVTVTKRLLLNTSYKNFYSWMRIKWKTYMIGFMQRHLLENIKLSFYSNLLESPCKKSVFLHNVSQIKGGISDVADSTPMRILFVGIISYFPNRYGIIHFVENIFPLIRKKMPQVELNIVGLCDDDVFSKLDSVEGVNVCGYVKDLKEEYLNSRVVVVPIYHGAGTCIKFIEGMMMNRPIVSTPIGARGYNMFFKANKHYMLAKTDQEFADCVLDLLVSKEKANKMAHQAYCIGETLFSKNRFLEIVKKSIDEII